MVFQEIEVRAISARYDAHARQLASEIEHLSTRQLPSLTSIVSSSIPLYVRTAQLYRLSGRLTRDEVQRITQDLLIDPVVQQARNTARSAVDDARVIDVFFHPGVTDTLAESVLLGARMLGIKGLERVETGRRYILDERLSGEEARIIAQALLYNPVIQRYHLHQRQDDAAVSKDETAAFSRVAVTSIPLTAMSDEQLLETSRTGLLALSLEEMRAVQGYYREQGREPTDVELETLAQTWSEHCSHKTFKATVAYREVDDRGEALTTETIPGLLKHYIMRATQQVKPDWLVSAFSDNAGIVRFTDSHDLAFKVETHNHPSAIEPFGGANTGVGGVIRDVLGVSAQPIACTDILCFGPLDTPVEALPPGVLMSRRIASGVVDGVRDYGNKMGIPTVNGAILYHEGYCYNPLVFCGCLGMLPHGSHPRGARPGDLVVTLGGRTGRDGVHGATFSSGEMSCEINARAGAAVQIGAPITEKKVADVIMQARDRRLYHAITDCGAGGFSSAVGEMGADSGVRVELDKVPLKYQGLAPWEIWVSEAQERMVLAVPPEHIDELVALCSLEEVELSVIGTFTDDQRLTVTYQGQVVVDMAMEFLHHGIPKRLLQAVWTRQENERALRSTDAAINDEPEVSHYSAALLALLSHPTIASKEHVVRRYDHEVQGATVLKPLVGRSGNGPGDAAVLQPLIDSGQEGQAGVVIANGVNPLYGTIDPYAMALAVVDETLRNLTAVGGDIGRAALLDNFCWGNPNDPEQLGTLVRAVKGCHDAAIGFGTPFISGKDSLNNEYRAPDGRRLPVIPTLLISAVGVIEDAARTVDMALKMPGSLLYLIGSTRNELGGSHYAEVVKSSMGVQGIEGCDGSIPRGGRAEDGRPRVSGPDGGHAGHDTGGREVPRVDIPRARQAMLALGEAIRAGLVRSCHDLSEGGLAVAAAEMALAGMLGVTLDVSQIRLSEALHPSLWNRIRLFSESQSRFLVEIAPEMREAFERHMRSSSVTDVIPIGRVTSAQWFMVRDGERELMRLDVTELQSAWSGARGRQR